MVQDALWDDVLKMAAVVEGMITASVEALADGLSDRSALVKMQEQAIDVWEVRIERECLRILTLYEPVASDLRRLSAILRINSDLKRISDLAGKIVSLVAKLRTDPHSFPLPPRLVSLGPEVLVQIRNSLAALARCDVALARAVVAGDDSIDRRFHEAVGDLKDAIRRDPDQVDTWLWMISTAHELERIADHAAMIAEAVVFMREGEIIRHLKDRTLVAEAVVLMREGEIIRRLKDWTSRC
jgi:phosphate transport system protein